MVRKDLPLQYLFFLVCCFEPGCCHPVCRSGENGEAVELPSWFEGGPCVSQIPLPIPDPDRPWGASNCPDCGGACSGHYLKPEKALQSSLSPMVQPPSITLKLEFAKLNSTSPSSASIEDIARKVLLSPAEVSMWFEHLRTVSDNRKRGLLKQLKHGEKTDRQVKRAQSLRLSTIVVFAKSLIWISQIRSKSGLAVSTATLGFILCVWVLLVSQKYLFVKIVKSRHYLCYQYSFCIVFVVHGYNICMDIVVLVMKLWCFKSPSCAPGWGWGKKGAFDAKGCPWELGIGILKSSNPHLCPTYPLLWGVGHNVDRRINTLIVAKYTEV